MHRAKPVYGKGGQGEWLDLKSSKVAAAFLWQTQRKPTITTSDGWFSLFAPKFHTGLKKGDYQSWY